MQRPQATEFAVGWGNGGADVDEAVAGVSRVQVVEVGRTATLTVLGLCALCVSRFGLEC